MRIVPNVSSESACAATYNPRRSHIRINIILLRNPITEGKNRARVGRGGGTRFGVVAGHDPVDDLSGVDGVELVEEVERGEAPVGAVEADVLHHQRLERVLLLRRQQERALEAGGGVEGTRGGKGCLAALVTFSTVTM